MQRLVLIFFLPLALLSPKSVAAQTPAEPAQGPDSSAEAGAEQPSPSSGDSEQPAEDAGTAPTPSPEDINNALSASESDIPEENEDDGNDDKNGGDAAGEDAQAEATATDLGQKVGEPAQEESDPVERGTEVTAKSSSEIVADRRQGRDLDPGAHVKVEQHRVGADLDIYGRLSGHLRLEEADHGGFTNNGSRFGVHAFGYYDFVTIQGRAEWGIRLGAGDERFNLEAGSGGFFTVTETEMPPLVTRLGYVGADLGKFGEVYGGKQWGVYYDVSGWTDQFVIFGANASSTFNAGTDGGPTGTGRADNAVTYRVDLFDMATVGAQVQMSAESERAIDSFGSSLRLELPWHLKVGAAYNHFFAPDQDLPAQRGYDGGDIRAFVGGVIFDNGPVTLAVLYTRTWNHEFLRFEDGVVVYNTDGLEAFASYHWANGFKIYAGTNIVDTRDPVEEISIRSPNTTLLIAGGLYQILPFSFVYLEGQADLNREDAHDTLPSVVALGLRVNFSSVQFRDDFSMVEN